MKKIIDIKQVSRGGVSTKQKLKLLPYSLVSSYDLLAFIFKFIEYGNVFI